jgi:uncharacterized membrane protein
MLAIGLVAFGWALSHQWGSDTVFDDCARSGGMIVVLVSLIGLVLATFGGFYGYHAASVSVGSGRRFLGVLGALLAPFAAFAIVLQIAAGLILPPCAG